MGQSAHCNGYVQFDTTENALNAWQAFCRWSIMMNAKPDESYSIQNIDIEDDAVAEVSFVVTSSRYQNCIWQCEQIRDFFKVQPGVISIDQNVMTCEDSVNWIKEDDNCPYCGQDCHTNGGGQGCDEWNAGGFQSSETPNS